jgi:hypothetical protein
MLDAKYPRVVDEAADLIARVVPFNKVGRQFVHGGTISYHRHWTCLLPQHGPGKKHEREIALEPWQERLVACAVGVPTRLHPLGWLRVHQSHRQVRVRVVRLL